MENTEEMENVEKTNDENYLTSVRGWMQENLEEFQKKFLFFFIGLAGICACILMAAFGASGIATLPILATVATWCAPMVIKFWFSGFGAIFDVKFKRYEVYSDGTKKDVTTFMDANMGLIIKCFAAVLVAALAFVAVPFNMAKRMVNHFKYEKELNEKGTIKAAPRKHMVICAILFAVTFVAATIGNAITVKVENTSDLTNEEKTAILNTVEEKLGAYSIYKSFERKLADVTEVNGTVTFTALTSFEWKGYPHAIGIDEYTEISVNSGTYIYENGAWTDVSAEVGFVLSHMTLGHHLTIDAMREKIDDVVVKKQTGFAYRISKEPCKHYSVKMKDGKDKDGKIVSFLVDENFLAIEPRDNQLGAYYLFA